MDLGKVFSPYVLAYALLRGTPTMASIIVRGTKVFVTL